MARPQFVMEWAAADTAAALTARYRSEADGTRRMRLQGLWLLRSGQGVDATAQATGVHRRTVDRWVGWYRTGGLDGVAAHRPGGVGQPRRLTVAQEERVADAVASGRFRTTEEIRAWITTEFGVTYQPGGVATLMKRLRCHPKVPRPFHETADPIAQEAWKKGGVPRR